MAWRARDIRSGLIVGKRNDPERHIIAYQKSSQGRFILVSLIDGFASEPTTADNMADVLNRCALEKRT